MSEEESELTKEQEHVLNVERAQKLLQRAAEGVQEHAHRQIASVVSKCLQSVFGEEAYEFKILFEQKRGKTEARLVFVREENEIDPTSAAGGGVVDVAAFALRLACLVLSQPRKRRILILDEPFRFLSKEYRPLIREMLETLSIELQVQFIIVTHSRELIIGKVVEIT